MTAISLDRTPGFATDRALAEISPFPAATLSFIPDFVYAFDRRRRFVYANPAMLGLFGLSLDEMLGRTFADLDYPPDLADRLNGHIDRVLQDGVTIEDEVFFESPTGRAAYFNFVWGPAVAKDGSVELVVGVSRDTSERRAVEEALRQSEARLRAATDLVGIGIYAWDPVTGALEWDERLRALWGLPPDAPVDMAIYEAGIHSDDLERVREAIATCIDPAGDGRYRIEYRVIGRDDRVMRHIATSGRTTFEGGKAVAFIGAAIDVTAQRHVEAAIRANEAQFRSFAAHSDNLIWIIDPAAEAIVYRSAAYERIWGVACNDAPTALSEWMKNVHAEDRAQVEHAFQAVKAGEVAHSEYRIVRPPDGAMRWLRDTSFPILDDDGAVTRIGGITEDLTQADVSQVYIVSTRPAEARKLGALVRGWPPRAFVRRRVCFSRRGRSARSRLRARRPAADQGRGALSHTRAQGALDRPAGHHFGRTRGRGRSGCRGDEGGGGRLPDRGRRGVPGRGARDRGGGVFRRPAANKAGRERRSPHSQADRTRARSARRPDRWRHQQGDRPEARHQPAHGRTPPRTGHEPLEREQPDRAVADRVGCWAETVRLAMWERLGADMLPRVRHPSRRAGSETTFGERRLQCRFKLIPWNLDATSCSPWSPRTIQRFHTVCYGRFCDFSASRVKLAAGIPTSSSSCS